jgi:hypothetical protein
MRENMGDGDEGNRIGLGESTWWGLKEFGNRRLSGDIRWAEEVENKEYIGYSG